MKLAEALQERADLTRKLDELRERLMNNALVQEGEKSAEDPAELLEEYKRACARLEWLIVCINFTNCRTADDDESKTSLTALLARRDVLGLRLRTWRQFISEASQNTRRATRSEIRIRPAADVRSLQKEADGVAAELRRTDNRIQALNWRTDLEQIISPPEGAGLFDGPEGGSEYPEDALRSAPETDELSDELPF